MSRAGTLRRVQGPYVAATVGLALAGLLATFLGPRGQVNWWATALLMLAPVADAMRCVAVYRQQDEYGQTLMLRSADFAAGTMVGVYIAGYATFVFTQVVLGRREASE